MRMLVPNWHRNTISSDLNSVFDDFFNDFFNDFFDSNVSRRFSPTCDIQEAKGHYLVSIDMPGMKKDDLKIEVNDGILSISGERHSSFSSNEGDSYIRREKSYGKFQRTFSLPQSVNETEIEANFQDGVLNIAIPKQEKAKGRTIEIQSGKSNEGFFKRLLGNREEPVKEVKVS